MNEINIKIESHHSKIQVLNMNIKIMQGEINQIEINKRPSHKIKTNNFHKKNRNFEFGFRIYGNRFI